MAQIALTVQKIGNYSYLALDNFAISGFQANAGAGLPPPPLNEQVLGQPPTSDPQRRATSSAEQSDVVMGRAWGGWCLAIRNRLNAGQGPSAAVLIEAPSVDETDVEWYAKLTSAVTTADPLTFTPGFSIASSRYGRTFQVGDYVLIADFAATGTTFNFEIAQLTAISGAGAWTLTRKGATALVGQAQFGTPLLAHNPAGSALGYIAIYRLIDEFWKLTLPSPAVPQLIKLPWDNMCVAAVAASAPNVTPLLLNLIPASVINGVTQPAVPGLRTLNGAEYTLGNPATAALGQTSVLRLSVAGWHSFRNWFFEFDGAAPVTGNTNITLAYISPDRKSAYQVATFTIPSGSRVSFPLVNGVLQMPQNRRFPFTGTWPPHANLPLMVNGLNAAGLLINGFTLDPTKAATMQEDGELDYIVTQNATTAGVGLRGTVQT